MSNKVFIIQPFKDPSVMPLDSIKFDQQCSERIAKSYIPDANVIPFDWTSYKDQTNTYILSKAVEAMSNADTVFVRAASVASSSYADILCKIAELGNFNIVYEK